jgi:hypothetical protein
VVRTAAAGKHLFFADLCRRQSEGVSETLSAVLGGSEAGDGAFSLNRRSAVAPRDNTTSVSNPFGRETIEWQIKKYLTDNAGRYVTPIYIGVLNEQRLENSATATLLQIGEKRFIVTCNHVLEEYLGRHAAERGTRRSRSELRCSIRRHSLSLGTVARTFASSMHRD